MKTRQVTLPPLFSGWVGNSLLLPWGSWAPLHESGGQGRALQGPAAPERALGLVKSDRLGLEGPELRTGCQRVSSGTWRAELLSDAGNPGAGGHRGPPGPVLVPQPCCPRATLGSGKEPPPTQTETPDNPPEPCSQTPTPASFSEGLGASGTSSEA